MTIVDSAVWVDYFNGTTNAYTEKLDRDLVEERDIAVLAIIVTEVLQGFRTDSGFRQAERVLTQLPFIRPSVEIHVEAARLFRRLTSEGVTVRGAVDCIIAQSCIEAEATLFSSDSDFIRIAGHSDLIVWSARDG